MAPSNRGGVSKRFRFDFSCNEDVIGEILSRLPTKYLLRFRSVCKSWKALISRFWFVEKHLSRAKHVSRLQLLHHHREELNFTANTKIVPERCYADIVSLRFGGKKKVIIVGSCNGLVCLEALTEKGWVFFLWNPCTGDTKMLPELTSFSEHEFSGLGHDFSTKDYKVILGSNSTSATGSITTKVAIFGLKTGSWRTDEGLEHVSLKGYASFLNGSLHWLELQYDSFADFCIEDTKIISFDLREENFKSIVSLPTDFQWDTCLGNVGLGTTRTSNLFVYHYNREEGVIIWTMEADSWSKLIKIPIKRLMVRREFVDKISISENDAVLLCFEGCIKNMKSKVVLYDPKDRTSKLVSKTKRGWPDFGLQTIDCLETLVSPYVDICNL